LYQPAQFKEERVDVMHALIRAHPLATLVTHVESGIDADHIPMEIASGPEPFGTLRGHIARANPLWRLCRPELGSLVIFQGPQAYITPSFYPSKRESGEVVPTWNYAVVHARGRLRFIHDGPWLHALVSRLTDAHEAPREMPWKVGDAPPAYVERMLTAIVGFELVIESLTGKWKVSQNRTPADRRGVAAGLRATPTDGAREIAELLESREAPSGVPVVS
jgi:transcriptional regulator